MASRTVSASALCAVDTGSSAPVDALGVLVDAGDEGAADAPMLSVWIYAARSCHIFSALIASAIIASALISSLLEYKTMV